MRTLVNFHLLVSVQHKVYLWHAAIHLLFAYFFIGVMRFSRLGGVFKYSITIGSTTLAPIIAKTLREVPHFWVVVNSYAGYFYYL